jgi:hypothetical protein
VLAFLAGSIVFGVCFMLTIAIFSEVIRFDKNIVAACGVIAGLMAGVSLWIRLTPREVKDGFKHWIENW